jgi:hypothetical protein
MAMDTLASTSNTILCSIWQWLFLALRCRYSQAPSSRSMYQPCINHYLGSAPDRSGRYWELGPSHAPLPVVNRAGLSNHPNFASAPRRLALCTLNLCTDAIHFAAAQMSRTLCSRPMHDPLCRRRKILSKASASVVLNLGSPPSSMSSGKWSLLDALPSAFNMGPRVCELFISREMDRDRCAGTPGPTSYLLLVNDRMPPLRLANAPDSLRNSQFMPACTRLTANSR